MDPVKSWMFYWWSIDRKLGFQIHSKHQSEGHGIKSNECIVLVVLPKVRGL
uniref:Uncharacterized protein n=1 Tax=Octopus bimaculoides TaxID=37653 RepID=A0A0L8GQB7_OCTBM